MSRDGRFMNISRDTISSLNGGASRNVGWLAVASAAATALVFTPVLLRSPSTTQVVPVSWLIALMLGAPITAYAVARRMDMAVSIPASVLVGLPQVPLTVLLSVAGVWLDVQRGHLLAGSGEESMSYGIGTSVAFLTGIVLLVLVAVAARVGARRRGTRKAFRRSATG